MLRSPLIERANPKPLLKQQGPVVVRAASSCTDQLTQRTLTQPLPSERTNHHPVIDINLNINLNVGGRSQNQSQQPIVAETRRPTLAVSPPVPTRLIAPHKYLRVPPPAHFNPLPANTLRTHPKQIRVIQAPHPPPATVVTNVTVAPKSQFEPPKIATEPVTVVNEVTEVVESVIPTSNFKSSDTIEPKSTNQSTAIYIPSSVIEDDDIIDCPICKEKYRIRDMQKHSNKHRKSFTSQTTANADQNQTIVESLEKDYRQSEATEGQLQRLTYDLDPSRQRIRELFEAESKRFSEVDILNSYNSMGLVPPTTYIRYVDSVAMQGSQDFGVVPGDDRPESHRLPVIGVNPSFLGPYYEDGGAIPSRIPGRISEAIPSVIPGVTPQIFRKSNQGIPAFQRPALADIPSVISEKNSMVDSNSASQNSPIRPTVTNPSSSNAVSSGAYVNSFQA